MAQSAWAKFKSIGRHCYTLARGFAPSRGESACLGLGHCVFLKYPEVGLDAVNVRSILGRPSRHVHVDDVRRVTTLALPGLVGCDPDNLSHVAIAAASDNQTAEGQLSRAMLSVFVIAPEEHKSGLVRD
jgi:hypothetical protein